MMSDEFLARRRAEIQDESRELFIKSIRAQANAARGGTWWQAAGGAVLFLFIAMVAAMVLDAYGPKNPDPRIAQDEKHLACRMMGQSWEYFGSLGWQCVPAAEAVKP